MFFNPSFNGSKSKALRWIVDNQLSPSPLGRAAFTEKALESAVLIGAKQYFIFAAGYDTFAYRQPEWGKDLQIFEIDHPTTAKDKQERLKNADIEIPKNVQYIQADFTNELWQNKLNGSKNFDRDKICFCCLLGLTYYLSKKVFEEVILAISSFVPKGSTIVFDYPDEKSYTDNAGERTKKQAMLAQGANEAMLASYSYSDMEKLLSDCGFLIYEHLIPEEITKQFFGDYNKANSVHKMSAIDNTNYCLAVKQ